MTRGAVPDGHKSEDGAFVAAAGNGLAQVATMIQQGVLTQCWMLLDWPQIKKYVNELLDDAIDWDVEGKHPPKDEQL